MPLTTTQAQDALKQVNYQLARLDPSSTITLFEIDTSSLVEDEGLDDTERRIFRFHNHAKLLGTSIWWGQDPQPNEYVAVPIAAEGFEITSRGMLPRPKLSVSVETDGIPFLASLKNRLRDLGDLIGAKVIRIRTFAAFLNARNFQGQDVPDGFSPNPNRELPRDVYYIDRKSSETKSTIEFELVSVLDLEGVQLPFRRVITNRCQWRYRGLGCRYEYDDRRDSTIHGDTATLPAEALPVATSNDELILDLIKPSKLVDMGEWDKGKDYLPGHFVYRAKGGLKFYFVCYTGHVNRPPPNPKFWHADICSKLISGCRIRWANKNQGRLPFGGYPGASKVQAL